jgi:hypothetical protein
MPEYAALLIANVEPPLRRKRGSCPLDGEDLRTHLGCSECGQLIGRQHAAIELVGGRCPSCFRE